MRFLYFASILLLLSSLAYSEQLPKKELKLFSSKVSAGRFSAILMEQGKKPDDIVSVKVPAIIFRNPIKIADVRKTKSFHIPEIDTLISYTKANISGSAREMAAFWAPSERKEQLEDMTNPEMFNKNRAYHQEYPGLIILGIIFQNKTTSVLIRAPYADSLFPITAFTFINVDGKVYLTNYPSNDSELAIIEASFR